MSDFVALLCAPGGDQAGNALILQRAFAAHGTRAERLDIDRIFFDGQRLYALDARRKWPLEQFGRIWLLGFGNRNTVMDRFQLLRTHLPAHKFVSQPDAVLHHHAKHSLTSVPRPMRLLDSRVSNDAAWLHAQLGDREWVLKPTGASFGRDVYLISRSDLNTVNLLAAATGFDGSRYALLQQRLPADAGPEMRVLVAGGQVIGQYARSASADRFATNIVQQGDASATTLDDQTTRACSALGAQLASAGIRYAGIDLAWPWVLEVNVANPGGLRTLADLGDQTAAARAIAAVSAACAVQPVP